MDGSVKLIDFGLATVVENATVESHEVYAMSGETGSLRYMAPEVAENFPYNASADVYSFGIILWELAASRKPFDGFDRDLFYERVVHGGERPRVKSKWPSEFSNLMTECWDQDIKRRPKFSEIVKRLDLLLAKEKGFTVKDKKALIPRIGGMIDRHSTWF